MKIYKLSTIFDFGKYKYKTTEEILIIDLNYIVWCIIEIKDLVFENDVLSYLYDKGNQIKIKSEGLTQIFIQNQKQTDEYGILKINYLIKTNNFKRDIATIIKFTL